MIQVFIDWLLAPGLAQDAALRRLQRVQELFLDILLVLPASSVEVERSHANTQVDINATKNTPPRPTTIQANTYLASALLAHQQIREAVDKETFGAAASRMRRALKARVVETGMSNVSMSGGDPS